MSKSETAKVIAIPLQVAQLVFVPVSILYAHGCQPLTNGPQLQKLGFLMSLLIINPRCIKNFEVLKRDS